MAIDTMTSEAIEVMNSTGKLVLQLTTNARRSVHGYYDLPPWSPVDGRIAFSRMDAPDSKTGDICVMDADGDNLYKVAESRAMSANGGALAQWASDGSRIYFKDRDRENPFDRMGRSGHGYIGHAPWRPANDFTRWTPACLSHQCMGITPKTTCPK